MLPTKWFTAGMTGGPSFDVGDIDGGFIALLKACLIDGFNTTTPTAVTYTPATNEIEIAYGTISGYGIHDVIEISGVAEAGYNGEYRVVRTEGNSVIVQPDLASAPAVNTATGTISVKTAPVGGWQIEAEDGVAHKICFSRTDPDATDYMLVVTNNGNQGDYSLGNEFMALMETVENFVDLSTYDTVMSAFWPAGRVTGNAIWDPGEFWHLVADGRGIWFVAQFSYMTTAITASSVYWGDIVSLMESDPGGLVSIGLPSSLNHEWDIASDRPHSDWLDIDAESEGKYQIAKPFTQSVGPADLISDTVFSYETTYNQITPDPNGPTGAPLLLPVYCCELNGSSATSRRHIRGLLPGVYVASAGDSPPFSAVIENVEGFDDIAVSTFCSEDSTNTSKMNIVFDLGDWRASA